MNILLTNLPATVTETPPPLTPGIDAGAATGDQQAGGEFALLLSREISAEPEMLAQDTEFFIISPGSDDAYAIVDTISGQLPADSLPTLPTGVDIDRELFASNPIAVNDGRLAVAASIGAVLPVGGSFLPAGQTDATVDLGGAALQSNSALMSGAGPRLPGMAASATIEWAAGGFAQADAGRSSMPMIGAEAGTPGIEAGPGAANAGRLPPGQLLAEARAEGPLSLPAGDEIPSAARQQFAAADFAVTRPLEVGPAGILPADLRPAASRPGIEQLTLTPAAGARQWGEALGERIHWMVNREQSAATLRLDPPTLGKLDVQLRISDDATTITIQAQHAQARDMIEAAAPRLREMLQENGFQNVNVDVSQRQEQSASDTLLANETPLEEAEGDETIDAAATGPASGKPHSGNRLLDTFA